MVTVGFPFHCNTVQCSTLFFQYTLEIHKTVNHLHMGYDIKCPSCFIMNKPAEFPMECGFSVGDFSKG